MKTSLLKNIWSYGLITLACAVYAFGFNCFFMPGHIAYGGVTGIAQIINAIFGWPSIGVLIIAMNIPIFLAGWHFLGRKLLITSLYAMGLSSVFIDLLASFYTFTAMDPLLASIYGGITIGFSMGIILLQGATTGGTDIGARLLKLRLAWLPIGRLVLFLDLSVIVAAALVFRTINSALYGGISLYISTLVMDGVVYGLDTARVAYIISEHPHEIANAISQELDRGATILNGEGAWSGKPKNVLLCAFKKRQIVTLKRLIKQLDPNAFLIVCDAHEVLGEGFHKKNDI
ncbi:hypothetical protein SDC9_46725 [bioreactor metagenome]|uniref:DUF2179 domain-containing protein n=1 Tax=bioreactor metagenome TaxID=1076179 RepID=A0A644WA91_9ZZZZ